MAENEVKRGWHKGGYAMRLEPTRMSLIKSNLGYEELFSRVDCLKFYQMCHIDFLWVLTRKHPRLVIW